MNNLHDLFLLMFSLSQMHDEEKIIELFQESLKEMFSPLKLIFSVKNEGNNVYSEEVTTRNKVYGYISSETKPPLEVKQLLQNAVQMLAVILEKLQFESELEKKTETLEDVDKHRLIEIQKYVKDLENARLGSINLIEDLKSEIKKRGIAQQLLFESEEKFRLAFKTSPDSININKLKDGKYIEINDGFTNLTAYTAEEIIGKTSIEINIWNKKADRNKLVDGLKANGKVENLEAVFNRKDGSNIVALMSASIIQINNEPHIISISRDITKIKEAQKKLQESEQRYRDLFENSNAVMLLIDPENGNIVDANPAASNFYGWPKKELVHMKIGQINPKQDYEISKELEQASSGKQNHFFFHHILADQSIRNVEVYTARIVIDGKKLLYSIVHDITDQKDAEEKIKLAAQQWQTTFDGMRDSIFILDSSNTILQANRSSYSIFNNKELIGKKCYEIVHGTPSHINGCPFLKMKENKRRESMPLEINGRWYEVNVDPLLNEKEEVYGAIHIITDITERKKAEEKIKTLNAELEQRVIERTAQLETANVELEEINDLFLGREMRIIELKEEIEKLRNKKGLE